MKTPISVETLKALLKAAQGWLWTNVLTVGTLGQIVLIGTIFLVARFMGRRFGPRIESWIAARPWATKPIGRVLRALNALTVSLLAIVLLWLSAGMARRLVMPYEIINVAATLLSAWVVIRLASSLVEDTARTRFVVIVAWTVAALNILHLLGPLVDLLDSAAMTLGNVRISLLTVIKGVVTLAVLLWLAMVSSAFLERRVTRLPELTPSVQVLLTKTLKVTLFTIAVVIGLSSIGVDLTAFAVFSGAVGVGIGFGLQKVVSNLISGVILLLDKSIKPGDVIEVADTYGWISSLGARYISVVTRDGMEYLIPNEDLITQRVTNWSYSNELVRLKVPIGVAYTSDVRKVMELILDAARTTERVLSAPAPVCLLAGFGESSVDFELRFWIRDPKNGTANVKSRILLAVWDRFQEQGIEIPFPQRDLRLRSAEQLRVTLSPES